MIEKKIYIAKDGTEFSEDDYPSAEIAKAKCEEYERTESAIEATIVLLDDKGNRITEFNSAFAIYCKTDEAARLLDILAVKEGYYSPWNNGLDGEPTAGYYLYDATADEWFDLLAKIAELTNIKKSLEEA
jgi:hypothetical protein